MATESQSARQFIFAPPNSDVAKRKAVARACESCRRRKKRCIHEENHEDTMSRASRQPKETSTQIAGLGTPAHPNPHRASSPTLNTRRDGSADSPGAMLAAPQEAGPPMEQDEPASVPFRQFDSDSDDRPPTRFIGHLNPEGAFLAATSPASRRGQVDSHQVGVWHTEKEPRVSNDTKPSSLASPLSLLHSSSILAQKVVLPVMEDQGLGTLPPKHHLEGLERFYFENIYPLLPLVDETDHKTQPDDHPSRILRTQGICLLASMNASMASHLLLPDSNEPQSHAAFGSKIFAAMRINIEMALVKDRLTLIRAWAMMSLYSSGPSSLEQSSQAFTRAIQLTFTVGLHLNRDINDDGSRKRLYACIWVLDRLHAAIHGRPVAMHAADMAGSPIDCVGENHRAFKVLVNIAILLDEVIGLYRPGSSTFEIPDEDFPDFEDIVDRCGASEVPISLQNTLEIFYHAVGILSCRTETTDEGRLRSGRHRNARHALCAQEIIALIDEESQPSLILLPLVPYAVALSLSVVYRHQRSCVLQTHQIRNEKLLKSGAEALHRLGEIFWSAGFIARMADQIVPDKRVGGRRDPSHPEHLETAPAHDTHVPNHAEQALTEDHPPDGLGAIETDPSEHNLQGTGVRTDNLQSRTPGFEWYDTDLDAYFQRFLDPAIPTSMEWGAYDDFYPQ